MQTACFEAVGIATDLGCPGGGGTGLGGGGTPTGTVCFRGGGTAAGTGGCLGGGGGGGGGGLLKRCMDGSESEIDMSLSLGLLYASSGNGIVAVSACNGIRLAA